MSKVLMDVYSVLVLGQQIKDADRKAYESVVATPHVLENLVLCDKILLEAKQSQRWGVSETTNLFEDVFEFVEGEEEAASETAEKLILADTLSSYANIDASDKEARPSVLDLYSKPSRRHREKIYRYHYAPSDRFLKRADYYLELARFHHVYLSIHPARTAYLSARAYKRPRPASQIAISHLDKRLTSTEAGQYAGVDLSVPPVVDYVIGFAAKNHVDILTAVREIRVSKNAISFRKRCAQIDDELVNFSGRSNVLALQKLLKDVDRVASKWEEDLDEGVKYVRRKISLRKVWGLGSLLEAFELENFGFKDPVIFSKDGDLLFLNDLYRTPTSKR